MLNKILTIFLNENGLIPQNISLFTAKSIFNFYRNNYKRLF